MAATRGSPGTSCSQALKDHRGVGSWAPGWGTGRSVCKAQVERGLELRGFSSTRLAWLQVPAAPRLLAGSSTTQWSSVSKSCQECPFLICTPKGIGTMGPGQEPQLPILPTPKVWLCPWGTSQPPPLTPLPPSLKCLHFFKVQLEPSGRRWERGKRRESQGGRKPLLVAMS